MSLSDKIMRRTGYEYMYPSFNQGVGGSIPALVDVSLSKTLNPEMLPVAMTTVYECNM